MLRRYRIICLIAGLCAAVTVSAAPVEINRLELSHQDAYTVLTIKGSAPIRVSHQSVEPKDGKSFRIVVDCLAARHMLPVTHFSGLPKSIVKSLHSGQNAVKPEEVVRIVMELNEESVYRMENQGNEVRVLISDPKTTNFPLWVSPSAGSNSEDQPAPREAKAVATTPVSSTPPPSQIAKIPSIVASAKPVEKPTTADATTTAAKPAQVEKTPSVVSKAKPVEKSAAATVMTTAAKPAQIEKTPSIVANAKPVEKSTAATATTTVAKPAQVEKTPSVIAKVKPVQTEKTSLVAVNPKPVEKTSAGSSVPAQNPVSQEKPAIEGNTAGHSEKSTTATTTHQSTVQEPPMQVKAQATPTKAPSVTTSPENGTQKNGTIQNPPAAEFAKLPAPSNSQTYGPNFSKAEEPKQASANLDQSPGQKTAVADKPLADQSVKNQPQLADAKLATEMRKNSLADLARKTAQKAEAFAALDNPRTIPPPPGDIPAAPGTKTRDEHMPMPPAATPAPQRADENPSAKTVPTTKPADSDYLPALEPLAAQKAGGEQNPASRTAALASVGIDDNQQSGDSTGKNTSKFRHQTPKSSELKASQVVQFPQRMVIEYESGDAADPFSSLIRLDKTSRRNMDLTRMPTIDALNLVGVLHSEDGKSAALMEDLDGIGYILKPGDRVKNGYVGQIDDQGISFQINEYGWDRTVTKYLQKEE